MSSARVALALFASAACLVGAGCASLKEGALAEGMPGLMAAGAPSPAQAQALVRIGESTKSELAAALGPANVIRFDSGWEVWVYRWPGAGRTTSEATELVVLFAPGGLARKVRVRAGARFE